MQSTQLLQSTRGEVPEIKKLELNLKEIIKARDETKYELEQRILANKKANENSIKYNKKLNYQPQFIIFILSLELIHLNLLVDSFNLQLQGVQPQDLQPQDLHLQPQDLHLQLQDLPLEKRRKKEIKQLISDYKTKMNEEAKKTLDNKWDDSIIQNESDELDEIAECLWIETSKKSN